MSKLVLRTVHMILYISFLVLGKWHLSMTYISVKIPASCIWWKIHCRLFGCLALLQPESFPDKDIVVKPFFCFPLFCISCTSVKVFLYFLYLVENTWSDIWLFGSAPPPVCSWQSNLCERSPTALTVSLSLPKVFPNKKSETQTVHYLWLIWFWLLLILILVFVYFCCAFIYVSDVFSDM